MSYATPRHALAPSEYTETAISSSPSVTMGVVYLRPRCWALEYGRCASVPRNWEAGAPLRLGQKEGHWSKHVYRFWRTTMTSVGEPIRILIADDHPIFRFGMRTLLTAMPDMSVVGEAVTGEEAIQLTETLLPDLVLMDIHMPGITGIEATARIHAQHPRSAILIVTMLDDDSVFAAMRAGARGYLLKGDEPAETLRAIRAVASGEGIFIPVAAKHVCDCMSRVF